NSILLNEKKINVFYTKTFRPQVHFSLGCEIERLRIRHQFIRTAVSNLNNLYSVQLGLSICVLCAMMLFDIYSETFRENDTSKSFIFVYGWSIQYSFRFVTIVLIAHVTTKQAHKTKTILADLNNRYLDNITKEEIQLFLNQISNNSMELTACDFFTLNTRLITSTIAAGTTYLIILFQFHLPKEQ
ncbi:gustatory and odorant receptor 22-like, partial [Daktulosphaira vitifoliae]|uniref:gustatory and odorant receptor 22-like n=1 Tax=Daktulosphaira vitifoliae TaxID=58002 RepID=UPI0021A9F45F